MSVRTYKEMDDIYMQLEELWSWKTYKELKEL